MSLISRVFSPFIRADKGSEFLSSLSKSRDFVVIPAYNEQKSIGRTIDLIRATGVPLRIVVVDDGSIDKTVEIAIKKGCEVVSLSSNKGKANAFFAGIKYVLREKAESVVTLDADMTKITKEGLELLVNYSKSSSRRQANMMYIAPVREGMAVPFNTLITMAYSGIRAFSTTALWLLMKSGLKSIPKGFGLELFLNRYFGRSRTYLIEDKAVHFAAALPHRVNRGVTQGIELNRMQRPSLVKKMEKKLKQYRTKRNL